MNSTDPIVPDSPEDRAALWAARIDGSTLTRGDRRELEAWLREDPAHRELLTRYCQFSADLELSLAALAESGSAVVGSGSAAVTVQGSPAGSVQTEPAVRAGRSDRAGRAAGPRAFPGGGRASGRSRRAHRLPWMAAAGLTAAAALAVGFWIRSNGPSSLQIDTAFAQQRFLSLPDGTRIQLNAHTSLIVENSRTERRVRLSGGEAFFMVSKDRSRPFEVVTPAGSVRVTGTSFDVRTDTSADLAVTVVEGSVQVRAGTSGSPGTAAPVPLVAGDTFAANRGAVSGSHLTPEQIDEALAWRKGGVVLDGRTLREALAEFSRYSGKRLSASEGAARLPVGGWRNLDDLEAFLSDFQVTCASNEIPVRTVRAADGSIRVSLASEAEPASAQPAAPNPLSTK